MLGLQTIPGTSISKPLSLELPKQLPVPDVANHLVCSICGARNDELKRPIHARPDARNPGVTGNIRDRDAPKAAVIDRPARGVATPRQS